MCSFIAAFCHCEISGLIGNSIPVLFLGDTECDSIKHHLVRKENIRMELCTSAVRYIHFTKSVLMYLFCFFTSS